MPEARISWRGFTMNRRTVAMVEAAERLYHSKFAILQGSYNAGGVEASAGTHDGGGAVDVDVRTKSAAQRVAVVKALREVGFAAWLRTPAQGNWPYHVHAIAVAGKDLSKAAARQVADYHRLAPPRGVPWHVHFRRMMRKIEAHYQLRNTGQFEPGVAAQMKRFGD